MCQYRKLTLDAETHMRSLQIPPLTVPCRERWIRLYARRYLCDVGHLDVDRAPSRDWGRNSIHIPRLLALYEYFTYSFSGHDAYNLNLFPFRAHTTIGDRKFGIPSALP